MAMRWLNRSLQCAAAAFALLVCSAAASAQIPPPGYIFLEASDEADKPVSGAATVVYDSDGKELESSFTDIYGHARLFRNRDGSERFVFRAPLQLHLMKSSPAALLEYLTLTSASLP